MSDWSVQFHLLNWLPAWADGRLLLGGAGVVLLLMGARVYRLALILPGFIAGVLIAGEATQGLPSNIRLFAALVLGLACAFGVHLLERFAVAVAGALVGGGLAQLVGGQVAIGLSTFTLGLLGALVGFLLFPWIYRRLLPFLTSLLGALAVAHAAGRPGDLLLIGGLTLGGTLLQLLLGGRGGKADKKKKGKD